MIKPKLWKGNDLKGTWHFTLKLDGVRAFFREDGVVSRADKPLYNIPTDHDIKDAEVFFKDWKTTVSAVRTKDSDEISKSCIYSLDPLDSRLDLQYATDPTKEQILSKLAEVRKDGHEGLVIRNGDTWLKVKPEETYDIEVLSAVEGKGKFKGMLGVAVTSKGGVGTGFTTEERIKYWTEESLVGKTIEVSAMELTDDGKFRHPRFIRERFDK